MATATLEYMRTIALILLVASAAQAQPALSPIDREALPEQCLALAKLADSPSRNQALSARISLATCRADHALKPIALCDCEQSVREVDDAIAPSLALLDEVYLAGDSTMKILARHTLGEMLANLGTRLLATVPPAINESESAVKLRELRLEMLQALIEPWVARARTAFSEVDQIARANPQLAKNAAVLAAVRSARARQQGVARR